ncbi:MAG: alpha/beta fold hydrolase [Candidatus Dormibacteria bacterium]
MAEKRFQLPSGEIAAEISGAASAPLVIGIPGLSVNLRCFDVIYDALDPQRHRRLAYDPRGRGKSDKTRPGSYGWPAHAQDIIAMADALGAETFDLIGLSMGAWIAMKTIELNPGRVRRLVLLDAGGDVDESVTEPIYAGLDRLATVWPSREAFLGLVQQFPQYQPWPVWERLFQYELEDVEGGVRARSRKEAALEDDEYRQAQDPHLLWKSVTIPTLIVRATQPVPPDFGYVLPASEYQRFLREVPTAKGIEVEANHYTLAVIPETAKAIAEFLD